MTPLYIVFGYTGEYSDSREWNVAAYTDKAMAQAHAEAAKRWYQEHGCLAKRNREKFENPFDPDMDVDYTGTDWSVAEVELRTALPVDPAPVTQTDI